MDDFIIGGNIFQLPQIELDLSDSLLKAELEQWRAPVLEGGLLLQFPRLTTACTGVLDYINLKIII